MFHFFNFRDHNRMCPCPLKYGPASANVFADEWHEFLTMIRKWHSWSSHSDALLYGFTTQKPTGESIKQRISAPAAAADWRRRKEKTGPSQCSG